MDTLEQGNYTKQKTAREAKCTICETVFVAVICLALANYTKNIKEKHKNMVNPENKIKNFDIWHHEKCVCFMWGIMLEFKNPLWKNAMHLKTLALSLLILLQNLGRKSKGDLSNTLIFKLFQ